MSPLVGGSTLLLVGVVLIRLTVTDAYQRYVRTGMWPILLAAGALLVLLGVVTVVVAFRSRAGVTSQDLDAHGHGHDGHDGHEDRLRVGWLLLVPVLALLLVTPPALGSFGVDRGVVVTQSTSQQVFDPLPAGSAPRPLTVLEFDQRAFDRDGSSLRGATVQLTGFVARPVDGDGFRLARYQIACCAADAVAAVVRVVGPTGPEPPRDAWFTVTGTFSGLGADGVPELSAVSARQVPAPVDPYE